MSALDPLGHHAITCKCGGDVVVQHYDVLAETCRRTHLSIQVEVGNCLISDHSRTQPANLILTNWTTGRTAAFDISVTSPLNTLALIWEQEWPKAFTGLMMQYFMIKAGCVFHWLQWDSFGAWVKEAMDPAGLLTCNPYMHTFWDHEIQTTN